MTTPVHEWTSFALQLSVKRFANGRYIGVCMAGRGNRAFGGQLVGQALMAVGSESASERVPLSLRAMFLEAADASQPVEYEVAALRRGRSFEHWRVDAFQSGKQVLSCAVAMHEPEPSPDHSVQAALEDPSLLPSIGSAPRSGTNLEIRRGLGMRRGRAWLPGDLSGVPHQQLWLRCLDELSREGLLRWAVLLWGSDLEMAWTADLPHRGDVVFRVAASLDHVVHFHEGIDPSKWWLYEQVSPVLRDGRALTTGRVFGAEGRLAMSVSQQSLLRLNYFLLH